MLSLAIIKKLYLNGFKEGDLLDHVTEKSKERISFRCSLVREALFFSMIFSTLSCSMLPSSQAGFFLVMKLLQQVPDLTSAHLVIQKCPFFSLNRSPRFHSDRTNLGSVPVPESNILIRQIMIMLIFEAAQGQSLLLV